MIMTKKVGGMARIKDWEDQEGLDVRGE